MRKASMSSAKHRSSDSFFRNLPPWLLQGYGVSGSGPHWSSSATTESQKTRQWKKIRENQSFDKSSTANRDDRPVSPTGRHDSSDFRYKSSITSTSAIDTALAELSERVKWASRHVVHPSSPNSVSPSVSMSARGRQPSTAPSGKLSMPLAEAHDCSTAGCQRVIINVSGQRYETQLRTLARFPNTLLGDPVKRRRYWDARRNEFFLDRHRPTFQAILYYYQSGGRLRRPIEVPEDVFLDEMEFYELGEETVRGYRQKEGYAVEKQVSLPSTEWQRRIWMFCEEPNSSIAARIFAIISVICILVSVVNFCMETLPKFERPVCINVTNPAYTAALAAAAEASFAARASPSNNFTWLMTSSDSYITPDSLSLDSETRHAAEGRDEYTSPGPYGASAFPPASGSGSSLNLSSSSVFLSDLSPTTSKFHHQSSTRQTTFPPTTPDPSWPPSHYLQPDYQNPFFVVEIACVIWFTVEFTLRLISCPSKRHFCRSVMNAFDALAIIPFFVILAVQQTDGNCESAKKSGSFVFVRVLRVFRIFKLSKHSQGLRILGLTIKTSMHELGMFFFFLIVAMVIFSSAAYYAEAGEEDTQLTSIPGAFWWAIVTMTTVGYGDVTPVGVWGKLVGTLCVIAGVLTIALPVPVVVANFNNFYRHES